MATRRKRIPMVGDRKPEPLVVPEEETSEEVTYQTYLKPTGSFSDEGFDWDFYEETIVACLVVHNSVDGLVDMWKLNANMLDWAKKVAPQHWQRIRSAFAERKSAIIGD